jgi:hypothetical protein
MKINAEWHRKNPMPKNPTQEQRMKWHVVHARHCSCREIPPKLHAEMTKLGFVVKPRLR